jgi:hypothetical protein
MTEPDKKTAETFFKDNISEADDLLMIFNMGDEASVYYNGDIFRILNSILTLIENEGFQSTFAQAVAMRQMESVEALKTFKGNA